MLDEHAHIAVDVLQDMFFHSVFDEQEIEREKNVVLEEIRMVEDTPDDLVHELLSEASFGQSTLANPILGTEETLASFTREQILSYMDNYYVGERVVISVAGHYHEDLLAQLEDTFSAVPSAKKQHQPGKPCLFLYKSICKKKQNKLTFA